LSNPFDEALFATDLQRAARTHALRSGESGTPAYHQAWFQFRRRIRIAEDLNRWRGAVAKLGYQRATQVAFRSSAVGGSNGEAVSVLNAVLRRAMRIDRCEMANAQVFDRELGGLRLVAHSGFNDDFLDFFSVVDGVESACGRALRSGEPVWVTDTRNSPIFAGTPALDVMTDAGSRAVASVPVISPSGRLLAMISTHHPRPTAWTERRKLDLAVLAESTGRLLNSLIWP
jgi:GAF domain-containing protein